MRKISSESVPLIILLATWVVFFSRTLFLKQLYFLDDLKIIYYPLEYVYAQFQSAWQLPQWSPLFGFGHPLLAWGQLGFFTPIHVLLRLFGLHPLILLQVSILSYFLLGLVGMYLFLKRRNLHPLAASLGAIVFTFSGFNVGHLNHVNFYVAVMVLPWLLIAIDAFLTKPTLRRTAILALVAAVIPLSGHAQMAIYTLAAAAIFGLVAAGGSQLKKVIPLTIIAGILAVSLASLSILPMLELLPFSDRAGSLPQEELFEFSYPPQHAITLIAPYFYGDHTEYRGAKNFQELAAYVGLIPLLLAIYAITSRRSHRPELYLSLVFIGLALVIAPGVHSPVYKYLVEQEIVTSLAIPGRFVFFFDLGITLLAALGLHYLIKKYRQSRRWQRFIIPAILIFTSLNLVFYGWNYNPLTSTKLAFQSFPWQQDLDEYRANTGLPARLLTREDLLQQTADATHHATEPVSTKLSFHQPVTIPANNVSCLTIPLYAADPSGIMAVQLKDQLSGPVLNQLAIVGGGIDNFTDQAICFPEFSNNQGAQFYLSFSASEASGINLYFQPTSDDYPERAYLVRAANPTTDQLQASQKNIRLVHDWSYLPEYDTQISLASRHLQVVSDASSARWIAAFSVGAYRQFIEQSFANDGHPVDGAGNHFLNSQRNIVNLSGVTHLAQVVPDSSQDLMAAANFIDLGSQSSSGQSVNFYANPAAYPKAFIVPDSPQSLKNLPSPISNSSATITNYQDTQITIITNSDEAGYLILTDTWTPEWQVTIDGQAASSDIAYGVFRSTSLSAGPHEVIYTYRSPAIALASKLTLLGLVITGLLLVIRPYAKKYNSKQL